MKIVNITGGLGNQFFQYAFGKSLQSETDEKVKYDITWFESDQDYDHDMLYLDFFNTEYKVANSKEIKSLLPIDKNIVKKLYNKFPIVPQHLFNYYKDIVPGESLALSSSPYKFKYSPKVYSTDADSYFAGHWQVARYVNNVSSILKRDFSLIVPMSEQSKALKNDIKTSESVSIHIRRGDYTWQNSTLPLDYYRRAIEKIKSHFTRPNFYIFSDDIEWAKGEFSNYDCTYVDHNGVETAYEDLMLMASCKHNIIANSTFSWWSAWLNQSSNKIIIAPDVWLGWDTDNIDVLPNAWTTISTHFDDS